MLNTQIHPVINIRFLNAKAGVVRNNKTSAYTTCLRHTVCGVKQLKHLITCYFEFTIRVHGIQRVFT
jgi:hypothetical protein